MAPREVLALTMPKTAAPAATEVSEGEEQDAEGAGDELNPFERGPEITETR
jgi:hypothetical protein